MMNFAGLSTDIPWLVKRKGSTPFIPPARINIAITKPAQTAKIKYRIILSLFTLTFLLLTP